MDYYLKKVEIPDLESDAMPKANRSFSLSSVTFEHIARRTGHWTLVILTSTT